jgi:hypothetical protein
MSKIFASLHKKGLGGVPRLSAVAQIGGAAYTQPSGMSLTQDCDLP